ncbi:hypothetical protein BMJ32_02010, partial [Sinorhizobium medicae]
MGAAAAHGAAAAQGAEVVAG